MKKLLVLSTGALAAMGVFTIRDLPPAAAQAQGREVLPLQLEEEIPVPGVAGRLDHFSSDAKRRRLFVSEEALSAREPDP